MVLIGDGPKGGLQGASGLEEMMHYCLPFTSTDTFCRRYGFDQRLYYAVLVESGFHRCEEDALEEALSKAKAAGGLATLAPILARRGGSSSEVEYKYAVAAIRRNGVSIIKG